MYHTHMVILILETNSIFKNFFQKCFMCIYSYVCAFFLIHVLHSITCVCLLLYFINKFVYLMKYTECSDLINERRHIPIT